MNYKKLRAVGFMCLVSLLSISFACRPHRGKLVLQTWETSNQSFKVRIRQFNEQKTFLPGLPGYYYVFEATDENQPGQWREVATVRTDDDVGIPREQVRFVNASVGYFFMGQICAVTMNSGNVWSVWNAPRNGEPDAFIKNVSIAPDGAGVMTFHPIPNSNRQPPDLFTNDYGQHWQPR